MLVRKGSPLPAAHKGERVDKEAAIILKALRRLAPDDSKMCGIFSTNSCYIKVPLEFARETFDCRTSWVSFASRTKLLSPWLTLTLGIIPAGHGGNTEEKNDGYVVFSWNTNGSEECEEEALLRTVPTPRYLKTTWTVFPSSRIFASYSRVDCNQFSCNLMR
jgi:hypothetical protein